MSRLPFELFLALRLSAAQTDFCLVITLISILGVALGVAVLIIVISVMTGFDHDLRDKILGFNAHLTMTEGDSLMKNYQQAAAVLRRTKMSRAFRLLCAARCWL